MRVKLETFKLKCKLEFFFFREDFRQLLSAGTLEHHRMDSLNVSVKSIT